MIDDAALVLVPGPGLQSRPPDQLVWTLATSDVSAWRPTCYECSPTFLVL